jgi:hypothetical protein
VLVLMSLCCDTRDSGHDFAARRVIMSDHEVERLKNIREVGAGEGHGLNAREIQRVIGPNQEQARLGEECRLLDAELGRATARRHV